MVGWVLGQEARGFDGWGRFWNMGSELCHGMGYVENGEGDCEHLYSVGIKLIGKF